MSLGSLAARAGLVVLVLAGLVTDAWTHLDLAPTYDFVASTTLSQGDLFRAEAIAAIVAGVLLLALPRRWTAALAGLVGLAGAVAVLVYRYADVPAFGPIPQMYEPIWYTEKTVSLIGEIVAFVAAAALVVLGPAPLSAFQPALHRDTARQA